METFFPRLKVQSTSIAGHLNHDHIDCDVMFSFLNPETKLHTTVLGTLRNVYHTADSTTLSLTSADSNTYDYTEFTELSPGTIISFLILDSGKDKS